MSESKKSGQIAVVYRYCNLSRFFDSDVIKNRTLDQTNKQFLWKVPWIHQLTILFTFFMDGPLDSPDEAGLLLQPKLRTALGGKIDGWINFPLSLTPSWLWQCLPNCVTTIMEFSYQLAHRAFNPQKI